MALGDDWKQDLGRTVESFFADRAGEMEDGFGTVTLENMLTMQAGIEWNEMTEPYADAEGNYSSLNDEIRLYETDDPAGPVLARGKWNGEQLVDPGWFDAMTARHVETIPWYNEEGMNSGYGYMWYRGAIGAEDVIFAAGNGDQRIMVFPDRELVITI